MNLNLPSNHRHNYHLLDEQTIYLNSTSGFEKTFYTSGFSAAIPFFFSTILLLFCFFFVNYLWQGTLYGEIFSDDECTIKSHIWSYRNFLLYLLLLIWYLFVWFESIKFEDLEGFHTSKVNTDYTIGFVLFLASEVMFFLSIFWAFFHFSLSSSLELGYMWPPYGIDIIEYGNLPFFNTVILVVSGLFATWAHASVKKERFDSAYLAFVWTLVLAILFIIYQWTEYSIARFNINDSVFGSVFYFGTGFHGLHVLLGTIALFYNFEKLTAGELSGSSHLSLNYAIWYWHFVDVIWIFLFLIFYVWGQ
jgi:cytochrome c oxidase subunit 3